MLCRTKSLISMSKTLPTVLRVRVSAQERALLKAAAGKAGTSLSDFMRRQTMEAAEIDVLERRVVTIPAKDWAKFEAWATAPANKVPALRKLAKTQLAWQG